MCKTVIIKEVADNSGIMLKVITPIIIILTFIIKEYLTYKYFVKQHNQSRIDFDNNFNNTIEIAKKNWYLNVIVQPNVKEINDFYENLVIDFKKNKEELTIASNELSHKDYLNLVTSKQREFKIKKRLLEFKVINLVRSSSNSIATNLTGIINELDDFISKKLIDTKINDIEIEKIEKTINQNKVDFMVFLFKYIENTKN